MNTTTTILLIVIVLLGFPLGILIAKFAEDELRKGRPWFIALSFICLLALTLTLVLAEGETMVLLCTSFLFIIVLTLPSLIRLKNKKK